MDSARRNTVKNVTSGCDNGMGNGQDAVVRHKLLKSGVSNGSTKFWVAPLSTSIVRVKSPEQRLAADRATLIAMKTPKIPSGERRFGGDGSEGTGPSWIVGVAEAAGLGNNSAGDDPEVVETRQHRPAKPP